MTDRDSGSEDAELLPAHLARSRHRQVRRALATALVLTVAALALRAALPSSQSGLGACTTAVRETLAIHGGGLDTTAVAEVGDQVITSGNALQHVDDGTPRTGSWGCTARSGRWGRWQARVTYAAWD